MKNYTITVNGNVYEVTVEEGASTGAAPVARAAAPAPKAAPAAAPKAAPAGAAGSVVVPAPMPGKILGVKAAVGQASDGTVASVNVSAGDSVEAGATLVTLN